MCDICLSSPCLPQCLNYTEIRIGRCEFCKEDIYDWQECMTDSSENLFCDEDCALSFYDITYLY